MKSSLHCLIELPANYRVADFLAFHRRDAQEIAERVGTASLAKGIIWQGRPACLSIAFQDGRAAAMLAVDGPRTANSRPELAAMLKRMLGLGQDIEAFEAHYRQHPQIGPMIARHPGLRVPAAATPFEALTWAIIGQQISVAAAVSVRRKFIQGIGLRHSAGLHCYPDAGQVAAITEDALRQCGLSAAKAGTIRALAIRVEQGGLPLDDWARTLPIDEMTRQLHAIKGIGPWTISYALLRGFGWLDGSLHGDVAVRNGLKILLGAEQGISARDTEQWLAQHRPWRALVGAHLWKVKAGECDGVAMVP